MTASRSTGSCSLDGGTEEVHIVCEGVERSLSYVPISGTFQRDASSPGDASATYQTEIPAVFNPRGVPNCCDLDGARSVNEVGEEFPVFIDPAVVQPDPALDPVFWTLPRAIKYHGLSYQFR